MKIKKGYIIAGVVALLFIIGVGSCISTRNGIVSADQEVKKAWANVESAYQRRLDLIPNLVATVNQYAKHESSTLQAVTDARVGYNSAAESLEKARQEAEDASQQPTSDSSIAQQNQAQQNLLDKSRDFLREAQIYVNAVHEAYPDLKASVNFADLQAQLEGTENRINTERMKYNEAIEKYNNKILRFPGSLFAWGYNEKEPFKAVQGASKAPDVNQLFNE